MGNHQFYWGYLLTAAILAAVVFWRLHRKREYSLSAFFRYLFPKKVYGHRSTWLDVKFFVVNKLVKLACLIPLGFLFPKVTRGVYEFMIMLGGPVATDAPAASPTVLVVFTILAAISVDLAAFLGHLLLHKVKPLWEIHKVHHSAEVLTPISDFRVHPLDDLMMGAMVVLFNGSLQGVFLYFYPVGLSLVTYMQLNIVVFVFYLFGYNLRHSHIWLSYGPKLSYILMSPAQHQIHHSKNPKHFDKNMGSMLSLWDWLFGTLYVPNNEDRDNLEFGLARDEEKEFTSLWKLYSHPFVRIGQMLTARFREKRDVNNSPH